MYNLLQPVLILTVVWTGFYFVVKTITDYILKKKMIDKGFVDKESQALFKEENKQANNLASLKWGLIIFFGGIALIIMDFIEYARDSTLPFGLFAIFIAGGFLVYYLIAKGKIEG